MSEPTCPVTVWDPHASAQRLARTHRPCGRPATVGILCEHHEAERIRLGGGR